MCFLADVNECVVSSPCRSGNCVNMLGSYKCVSCGDGYQPRNGRCIGEELSLPLGSTLAPLSAVLPSSLGWNGGLTPPISHGQAAQVARAQHSCGLSGRL